MRAETEETTKADFLPSGKRKTYMAELLRLDLVEIKDGKD